MGQNLQYEKTGGKIYGMYVHVSFTLRIIHIQFKGHTLDYGCTFYFWYKVYPDSNQSNSKAIN